MSQSLSPHHLCKRFLQQNWSDSFGILLARCSAKRPHEWIDESLNALIVRTVDKVHRARQLVVSREAPPEPAAQSTAQAAAQAAQPAVAIEYEHLPGSVGDERWRQEAVESNLTIAHK